MQLLSDTLAVWDAMIEDEFVTLENAIKYNQVTDKLLFIAEALDLSPTGNKVLKVEDKLINLLQDNNIELL
jgi:hypothetical protein